MGSAHGHQHDLIPRVESAHPVDHGDLPQIPARTGIVDDLLQQAFGHTRVMLQVQPVHGLIVVTVEIAHQPGEGHDGPMAAVATQAIVLRLEIEIRFLNTNHGHGIPSPNVASVGETLV